MPVLSGEMAVRRRRSSPAGRRRWLVVFGAVILMVVAVLANIGPLTHYEDARARFDAATEKVNALEAQKTELQGQLAKLSEAGYLETLAREQLTYVRPGEELYIVTKPAGDADGSAPVEVAPGATALAGIGAGALDGLGSGATSTTQTAGDVTGSGASGAGASAAGVSGPDAGAGTGGSPGFFERVISGIRGLF